MRLRAGNHGASAAAKSFTVAVMVLATFAQFASLEHEMTVRHFRCAEDGELTHIAPMTGTGAPVPLSLPRVAMRAPETNLAHDHEHCGVASALEGSSFAPAGCDAGIALHPLPLIGPALGGPEVPGWACGLVSAPKTSPPAA